MKKTSRKAFSLVELVVVILIIAILAAAVFLGGATVIQQSRESAVKTDLRNFASYVQDMLYDNPEMQYNSGTYGVNEGYTFDATTTKYQQFAVASGSGASAVTTAPNVAVESQPSGITAAAGSVTVSSMPILNKLNERYLTADFKLNGTTKDAWNNPYCYSYDMSASQKTGDPASCIIVINSLGKNSLDETSDATASAATRAANSVVAKLGTGTVNAVGSGFDSATDVVANLGNTGDDYGVVICMIDGAVSTAYYGF